MSYNGGPAFPGDYNQMSLRDYLAAHAPAMPPRLWTAAIEAAPSEFAKADAEWRYAHADAMLKARGQ